MLSALSVASCSDGGSSWNYINVLRYGLTAECTIKVTGVGIKDMETDYLPGVVACEHQNAPPEALKAQAIAARTYAYFHIAQDGEIADGQNKQVYTCDRSSRPILQKHRDAVQATSGQVIHHNGIVIAAFYVAGAKPTTANCVPSDSDKAGAATEQYVTYNEGKSGSAVSPSSLGHPANPANRGCLSQHGASCLDSTRGYGFKQILRYYYGADIDLITASGSCVVGPSPDAAVDAGPDGSASDGGADLAAGCDPQRCSAQGSGYMCCAGRCIDATRDLNNCGQCGNVCFGEQTCRQDGLRYFCGVPGVDPPKFDDGGCALAAQPAKGAALWLVLVALMLVLRRAQRAVGARKTNG